MYGLGLCGVDSGPTQIGINIGGSEAKLLADTVMCNRALLGEASHRSVADLKRLGNRRNAQGRVLGHFGHCGHDSKLVAFGLVVVDWVVPDAR